MNDYEKAVAEVARADRFFFRARLFVGLVWTPGVFLVAYLLGWL